MKPIATLRTATIVVLCAAGTLGAFALGKSRQDAKLIPIAISSQPPAGAVALFIGGTDQISTNFYKRYTKENAGWTIADGVATPNKSDITSKQEFGDCYVHAEFNSPATHGNSGVGLMGRYEVQINDSFGKAPEKHECGAFYDQKPPIVNACKPAGEWQSYDIVFRAPRFDADGKLTEKARATVFQNGVLVQNNEEFNGPTGIQYGENKGEVKTGPLILQGDHDVVRFRNVWVVPL